MASVALASTREENETGSMCHVDVSVLILWGELCDRLCGLVFNLAKGQGHGELESGVSRHRISGSNRNYLICFPSLTHSNSVCSVSEHELGNPRIWRFCQGVPCPFPTTLSTYCLCDCSSGLCCKLGVHVRRIEYLDVGNTN